MKQHIDIVIPKLEAMQNLYQKRGIPTQYYEASLSDLYFRYDRYEQQHGVRGLSEWDLRWLTDVFDAQFFNIGVLRFQLFTMDYALIERSGSDYMPLSDALKKRFPEGSFHLNIHIVKNADLSPSKVAESFEEARTFFKTYFADYHFEYFICRTWLLDESLTQLLPPSSNLIQFRNCFEILTRNHHQTLPLDRIYGSDDLEIIKHMEHQTTLQKNAYKIADQLGVTFACIPFDDINT